MAGLLNEAGGAPPPGGAPAPGGPPEAPPGPGGGEGGKGDNRVLAMLILQPLQLLYKEDQARKIIEAAKQGNPAQIIAAAAISAITASAKAGANSGAKFTPEQVGQAVIEVIKALGALLVAGQVVPPEQVGQVIEQAVQFANQGGAGGPEGAPPPGAGGPPPGPPGAPPGPPGAPPAGPPM